MGTSWAYQYNGTITCASIKVGPDGAWIWPQDQRNFFQQGETVYIVSNFSDPSLHIVADVYHGGASKFHLDDWTAQGFQKFEFTNLDIGLWQVDILIDSGSIYELAGTVRFEIMRPEKYETAGIYNNNPKLLWMPHPWSVPITRAKAAESIMYALEPYFDWTYYQLDSQKFLGG